MARLSRDDVLRTLSEHQGSIRAMGVSSLALFGSAARNRARAGSDIDLLVEFDGPATFDRYMGLKEFLEDVLSRPVDLVTRRALKPALRPEIERDAIYVTR